MSKKFKASARYSFAIGSVSVATLAAMLLTPLLGADFPFLSFYLSAIATCWFAGFAPGILSILLGFIASDLFFYTHTLDADPGSVALYLIVTFSIAFFAKAMHEARHRSEVSDTEARLRHKEVEEEVSLRRKVEDELALSEQRFHVVFDKSAIAQAQIDPANGRFLRVNHRLCKVIGFSQEELLDMTIRQITFPADNDWDTKMFRRMIEGQTPDCSMEKRYICKGGRVIWVTVAASPIRDKEGRPMHTHMLIRDVTAQHQAEEALHVAQQKLKTYTQDLEKQVAERTAKLTESIQSLEGLCYSIAHDLRGPVLALQSYTAVLSEKCSVDPRAQDCTRHISEAAIRVDNMVEDLLTYGRLAHEPMPREPLHLESIVDRALARLAGEIDVAKAQMHIESPLPQALGHPPVLEQVIINLLRNALKFVRPGVAPEITIRSDEQPEAVRLWVVDNGIGINPQYYDKIFQIFERLERTEESGSTGIGLAIVRKGIERMGGHVGVVSAPGSGSSFWFELGKVA